MDSFGTTVAQGNNGYVAFNEAEFKKAQAAGKDVAVFFHSKTCGSCAKLDGDIAANAAKIPSDTMIMKADWDENQDLAAQWGVDKYHTVSVVDGNSVKNVKGLFTLDEVMANL